MDGFIISEPIQDSLVLLGNSDFNTDLSRLTVFEENCFTDAIQPAPCLLPQPSASPYPTPNISSMFSDSLLWIEYLNPPENTDNGLGDCFFFTTDTPSESASPIGGLILANNSYLYLEITLPANIFIPSDGIPSYSMPFTPCPNLDERTLPNLEPDPTIASPKYVFARSFDKGLLYYPILSSSNIKKLSIR